MVPKNLRIGVDVGGTNTDGVLLNPTCPPYDPSRGIIARHKAPTTPDPSEGIAAAIKSMFASSDVAPSDVASVTIGTTHFVNAVVERDVSRLSKVAVIRLCGPYSKHVPPCVDWPGDLRGIVLGCYALVKGGLEVDGGSIFGLDEGEVVEACREIKAKGIKSVVINGIFSPIDAVERQEERAAEIVRREVPGCEVVCSKEVANLGFLERENAAILNASILEQQAAYNELAGVRMNFSCPDIKSIGLGGGSIVRKGPPMTVGSDSVGYRLTKESIVFGGKTLTVTDCAVCADPSLNIGDPELVKGLLTEEEIAEFKTVVQGKLERIIDTMKTSPDDMPVVLVGGGAIIAPRQLKGASKVIKPQWSQVANAIGAAIARVSAVVDTIRSTEKKTTQELLEEICGEAVDKTVAAGAARESVKIAEKETLPLQYVANKTRFIVRAIGDFDFSRTDITTDTLSTTPQEDLRVEQPEAKPLSEAKIAPSEELPKVDISTYRPKVHNRVWYVNETDLTWISTGCYILGTGGGGSPYPNMILLRELLRAGAVVRVVSPRDVPDNGAVGCGCGAGSPTVGIEKLQGDEMMEAQTELYKICPDKATHIIALEIGGGNGLQGMTLGASTNMDLPCVDGDWMGRAYPTKWQTTPVVFNERSPIWAPVCITSGSGNVVIMPKAASDHHVERIMRAALAEMGSQVAAADPPVNGAEMKRWVVDNTISQSWRIGRAVARARQENRIDNVAEIIVEECGGHGAAKVLFKGKIVGVERTLRKGHVYGECIIEGGDVFDPGTHATGSDSAIEFKGRVKIPFKNENIAAIRIPDNAKEGDLERQEDVLAIVPDLISVIDAQNGEAVGTPEYRYGLLVIVLGITASDKWTGSQRGIELGGPKAFGFEHLEYQSLGSFVKPASVIDEFDSSSAL
ncbi:hypothetical protein N0V88_004291 [Collariella sp. IMI 366227]|nr:hypothetical protein N0V88_004291 [Collariella sp. IMI 366227]